MGRRYRYRNPHDASPHYWILNCLIGFAVLLCLWNVWTAPPQATLYATENNEKYSSTNNDSRVVMDSKEGQQEQKQDQKQRNRISSIPYSSALSDVNSMANNPYLMMPPSGITTVSLVKQQQKHQNQPQQLQLIPTTVMNGQKLNNLSPSVTHGRRGEYYHTRIGLQLKQHLKQQQQQQQQTLPISARKLPTRDNGPKRNVAPRIRGLSVDSSLNDSNPSFQIQSRSRSTQLPRNLGDSSIEPLSSSSYSPINRRHLRWTRWLYAIAVSVALLAGGVFAKRALDRIDRWEQLSKEDSLAYDLAYTSAATDTYSWASDGSFASVSSTDWSGDYLDRFDV